MSSETAFTFKSIRSVLAATKHLNWFYLKIVISCRFLWLKEKQQYNFLYLFHILYFVHIFKWWKPWKLVQDSKKNVWLLLALEAYSLWISQKRMASQVAQMVKNPPTNAADLTLIPGSGTSPGERNSNPFQYSCLQNPMKRGAWQARGHGITKSQKWHCK